MSIFMTENFWQKRKKMRLLMFFAFIMWFFIMLTWFFILSWNENNSNLANVVRHRWTTKCHLLFSFQSLLEKVLVWIMYANDISAKEPSQERRRRKKQFIYDFCDWKQCFSSLLIVSFQHAIYIFDMFHSKLVLCLLYLRINIWK